MDITHRGLSEPIGECRERRSGAIARSLLAITAMACAAVAAHAANGDAVPAPAQRPCEAERPSLPRTIQLEGDLRAASEQILRRSATFRQQCRRMADAGPWLRVTVRRNPDLAHRSFRARSVIRKAYSGLMLVVVEITPFGSPVEWLAHEFEHVLEQLDGVRLRELVHRRGGVWASAEDTFETERAIRAGRTVMGEMKPPPAAAPGPPPIAVPDILVE